MIPLSFASKNEPLLIRRIGGGAQIRQRLEDLGFTVGTTVTVISALGENRIVRVKDSRIALDGDLARHIMV